MSFVETIKSEFPKSYHYFSLFYSENYTILTLQKFESLNFEFQLGVYIRFFNSVSTDVDIYSNEIEALQESTKEAFSQYQEYLFLDS